MAEVAATLTKLFTVQEIQEDGKGATLRFQQGSQARLDAGDANYATYLRLARRSHERQHPIGVRFGEGQAIAELIRGDNDVPAQLCEDAAGVRVFFQGHDGVFCLKADHPNYPHLRSLLSDAIRQKAWLWFIAQKPYLALQDILPTGKKAISSPTCDGNSSLPAARET
jgi:hypothetical protein